MAHKDLAHPGSPLRHRTCVPVSIVLFCAFFIVTTTRAQDVAEAARQEQARKNSQQKKNKHVYTEEDLKSANILTPEDRAEVEAKKQQNSSPTEKPADAIDAQTVPPLTAPPQAEPVQPIPSQPSLGEVARAYRRQKELQSLKPQQSAQFHLPILNAPLAAPKPPVLPAMRPPANHLIITLPPPRPPIESEPFVHPTRRSPFERPSHIPAPALRPHFSAPGIANSSPARPNVTPEPHRSSVQPVQPSSQPHVTKPTAPTPGRTVVVQPGDSLWKLAEQNLGNGLHWRDLLAANPSIVDPNHINAGTNLVLPSSSASPIARTSDTTSKMIVRSGDTLWKLAETHLGHGAAWTCIVQANPTLKNPQVIFVGQELFLPTSCKL
jgi:LysM repeat protein